MKIRLGFVSNSSSASFIVDLDNYSNTFAVAKAMLELITKHNAILWHEKVEQECAQMELELLDKAIKEGVDPNRPVFIPGNYDICIVKQEDGYDINTNFDYPFYELKGFDGVDFFTYMNDSEIDYFHINPDYEKAEKKVKESEDESELKLKVIENRRDIIVNRRKKPTSFEPSEYKINKYITLKFENNNTEIYIKNTKFNQCKSLLLQIPIKEIEEYDYVESIDEVSRVYDTLTWGKGYKSNKKVSITPKEEFWGHCSNLQAWAEHNYDTRILHSNLSFPLLKALNDEGDPIAKQIFREEIVKRLESGYRPVIYFLLSEGYLKYLDKEIAEEWLEKSIISLNPKVQVIFLGLIFEKDEVFLDLDLDEKDVNDLFSGFVDLEMENLILVQYDLLKKNLLKLIRYILSKKELRERFVSLLKGNLDKNYVLVEALLDVFLSNSNKEELKALFGTSISDFQNLFLEIVEKDGFELYYDNEMWSLFGKSISGLVKEKIINSLRVKDIDYFLKLNDYHLFDCLNKEDLISLFNYRDVNLVEYLVENVTEDILFQKDIVDGLYIDGIDDEVGKYISESIYKLLPNYSFKKYVDPLFALGFFGYLNKEYIMKIIEDPKIDYIKLLINQIYAWENSNTGREYVKKTLGKIGVKFKDIIMPLILKGEQTIYFQIIEHWLWDLFDWEDLKELLNDKSLNFLETLLVLCTRLAKRDSTIKYDGDLFMDGLYLFPKRIPNEFLKEKIREIILSKNLEAFVPLYAIDCFSYFNRDELVSMIKSEEFNLLIQVLDASDKYGSELYRFRESLYDINDRFFKVVKENIDAAFILYILKTVKGVDISPLFNEGLIEKISYAELFNVIKEREEYGEFMKNLNKFIYWYESEMGYSYGKGLDYYENLWSFLLEKHPKCLHLDDFELYLSLSPFLLIDTKFLEYNGVQFVIDLLEKADLKYIYRFFKDLRSIEMHIEDGSKNLRLLREIYPFLHVVGNYFTSSIKRKILDLLDDKLQKKLEDGKSSYSFKKKKIEIIYILFCLRWHLFFTKEELNEFKLILRKNHALFDVIYQEFMDKYVMSFEGYPVANVLSYYFYFINKEDVLSLLERLPRRKIIKLLQWLGELSDNITFPVNQYYRMGAKDIRDNISQKYKVERKEKVIRKEPELDLEHYFNKSVYVHEFAEKPCHFLNGCPYGPLVECFKPILNEEKSSCINFGHECPAFYLSEYVNENMRKRPPKDVKIDKLKDDIKGSHWFNCEKIVEGLDSKINKPCHELGWCPYGSLGDEFKPRITNNQYECKIYSHDCPVFYHFEYSFG